jgi:2-oxoglutarate dehydrogenase complex dehydrogenase (E1) component-like enzyme
MIYTQDVGYEFQYIDNVEERNFLANRIEAAAFTTFSPE